MPNIGDYKGETPAEKTARLVSIVEHIERKCANDRAPQTLKDLLRPAKVELATHYAALDPDRVIANWGST
jgi:hypothetical protein